MNLRTGNPGMHDVADDSNGKLAEILFVSAYGEHVQQRLGRMSVLSVAGIDYTDMRRDMLSEKVRRAAVGVANYEHVALHGFQVFHRVEQ